MGQNSTHWSHERQACGTLVLRQTQVVYKSDERVWKQAVQGCWHAAAVVPGACEVYSPSTAHFLLHTSLVCNERVHTMHAGAKAAQPHAVCTCHKPRLALLPGGQSERGACGEAPDDTPLGGNSGGGVGVDQQVEGACMQVSPGRWTSSRRAVAQGSSSSGRKETLAVICRQLSASLSASKPVSCAPGG